MAGCALLWFVGATAGCTRPSAAPAPQGDADSSVYLFSYFTRNGDDGLHLAYSDDGIKWLPLNGGRSVLRPAITGQGVGWMEWNTTAALMRDPCVLRGPDGVFHLVWTISWTDKAIGVAHSRDLIHWTPQKRVAVMEHEPTTLNTWAPELFYDDETQQYMIFWASSIPGRFPASDSVAQKTPRGRADHRLYYVTTRDFETFSPTRLLYDGGFSAIDGTIKKSGDTYYLVMKDETFYPKPVRSLRVASSKHATGPYGPASAPFTDEDTEGPSILRTGDWWRVYYDRYTRGRYGAVRTRDFVHWERVTDSLDAPRGIRHGSAFMAPRSVLAGLLALDSLKRASTTNAPYRDASRPVDERVRDLLSRMTLEEKFWQLYMTPGDLDGSDYSHGVFGLQVPEPRESANPASADAEHANSLQRFFAQTRLGIPIIPFEEAVHGLRRTGGTMFPQAIGLAATFDTSLMGRVATAIAHETRSRGIRQVLSPVVNIANDVRWGRVEETYGEDPVLSSAMAVAYVAPFERAGVIATPKHFVANVGDGGRDSYPIQFSDRLLEEVFYPPFRAAIGAGAQSVMSAYNSVDGVPATQNHHLLTDVLRDEWGFQGFVISDAAATGGATVLHHTEASTATATKHALESGLDVVFQSTYEQHRPYLDALQAGLVSDSVIDAAVARVLGAKFRLGLFDRPFVNPESASYWSNGAGHGALAAEAARASIVLLQNRHATLPFDRGIGSVAVIGADASEARLGGYSSVVAKPSTILDGIRAKLGGARVRYAAGPGRFAVEHVVIPTAYLSAIDSGRTVRGLRAEYFDNPTLSGAPRLVRVDQRVDFGWTLNSPGRGIPFDWYSVRWTGTLTVPAGGLRRLGVEGNDGYRLYLDDKLVVDDWVKRGYGVNLASVDPAAGSVHRIRLEFFESTGNARIKLVWDAGVDDTWRSSIDSAVAAARESDAAIVVAGIEEGEFRDRAKLGLPGHQEELIDRVAATGRPIVVVLVGGSAITMPWLSRVNAVVDVWYPGQAGGEAVADVLWGDYDPAGRLPITFPLSEGQLPLVYNHKPTGRGDDYLDLSGQPLFPFGHGLSYTTFEYSNLAITPGVMSPTGQATVRFRVKNSGRRAGDEVVQLYVRDLIATVARPVIQLEGFQRVHLAAGEERELSFTVGRDQLRMLDAAMRWIVEPGTFRILVGASSKDIRLRGDLSVQ